LERRGAEKSKRILTLRLGFFVVDFTKITAKSERLAGALDPQRKKATLP
jgi:hypothetical protein